ncbi:hypothetical protein SUGI_1079640 [Cryptomeria japonica]|nr:hypothetical protein SUGI_1079640 [Cryptomeria japonica]
MSSKEFRVPYQHLEQQIELSAFSTSPESNSRPENGQTARSESNAKNVFSLRVLILATMIGAGVQFGWALQGALLTPYIQISKISQLRFEFSVQRWACFLREQ